jgi:hypothetical protein
MRHDLYLVTDAIAVGIGHVGIGSMDELIEVQKLIVVGVEGGVIDERIEGVIDFPLVGHAIGVGVNLERAGVAGVDFVAVEKAIAIGVGIVGIGAVLELLEVREAVRVGIEGGVIDDGIEGVIDLPRVGHAIGVGIGGAGIRPELVFPEVREAVVVEIEGGVGGRERIENVGDLPAVG